MNRWKSLSALCIVCFAALTSSALALSPNAFMVTRNYPNEMRLRVNDVASLIPESGPLKETLDDFDSKGISSSTWPVVCATIQSFSALVHEPVSSPTSSDEEMMAAALMVPGATPDALIDVIADKDTKKAFALEESVAGLTAHATFTIENDRVYTALYQSGDETFLLISSSPKLFGDMVRQSAKPLNESFALQGPLHMTLSMDTKILDSELAKQTASFRVEATAAFSKEQATFMAWLDPEIWQKQLNFTPRPIDPKELKILPLFGLRRIVALVSTQMSCIPGDVTPQQLLSLVPPEELSAMLQSLNLFGITWDMVVNILRNPMTVTAGDAVDSPIGPVPSFVLHLADVPEQFINLIPTYGLILSQAFNGVSDAQKPEEFVLPDSSWKGYIVKKPEPFFLAFSPDRSVVLGNTSPEMLNNKAEISPSIRQFMNTPHAFAAALDVQPLLEFEKTGRQPFMNSETRKNLRRLDTITAFSDGDSRITVDMNFK